MNNEYKMKKLCYIFLQQSEPQVSHIELYRTKCSISSRLLYRVKMRTVVCFCF